MLKDKNLLLLLGAVMFAVTGGSLVGPILPEMLDLKGATHTNIGLALSAYTFCAMVATPLLGPVADRFGRKSVIVPSVMLFGLGGLLITFTRSFWLVLVWRALQGIGVGGMMNTVVAAIGDMFEEPARSRAMGYRVTVQSLTNATVPFVSGAIATMAWFLPFYIHAAAIIVDLPGPDRLPAVFRFFCKRCRRPHVIFCGRRRHPAAAFVTVYISLRKAAGKNSMIDG
jgi:MFS family permease